MEKLLKEKNWLITFPVVLYVPIKGKAYIKSAKRTKHKI